ncbi:GHKL domain-containing protein [Amphibacillus sp. Q70]|uniref:GHKL domain-containing protein n=1 Tax=Amphibacillus sp. Q70 TaxID=3453416 RepID=UPI003F826769
MMIPLILNIGVCLVILLFYLYLMNEQPISWKYILPIPIAYFIGINFVIQLTGYVEWNLLIIILLFFIGIFYVSKSVPVIWNLTASFFSLVVIIIAQEIILDLLFNTLAYSNWIAILPSRQSIAQVSAVMVIVITLLFRNLLMKLGDFLEKSTWLPIYFSMILIIGFLLFIVKGTGSNIEILSNHLLLNISTLYYPLMFAIFFLLIILISVDSKRNINQQLLKQEQKATQDYLDYVHELETSYQELTSFRHDYQNILFALDEGIQAGDLDKIKKIYQETIAPTSLVFAQAQNELVKLKHIQNEEIRSLFRVKLLHAQAKKINTTVDIPEEINQIGISVIKLIRISAIILDNAIEEAEQSSLKELQVSLFIHDTTLKFIVRNSCSQETIHIADIYKLGKSTKQKSGRGIGLYSLNKLLHHEPHVTVATRFDNPFFTQELSIQL